MDKTSDAARNRLSERQRQCLELAGSGFTSKEIGRQLGLSPSTVDSHIRSALEKLNISNRLAAARSIAADDSSLVPAADTEQSSADARSTFALPPLGGSVNAMGARRRVWHIIQIALLGIMGMSAAVITISGFVGLFKHYGH